ncbi:hypothetical protein K438DRAFT_1631728 [Mycena galopus ATCC 62051]|nr:hypothetical protein K438DRAFT_1631728 [Mycena galopus ATCC 62051]
MFVNPGILLKEGTQQSFRKIIMSLQHPPTRKSAEINLERIKCSISEIFNVQPTTEAMWSAIRSKPIPRLTRNFLWKCTHNRDHELPLVAHRKLSNIYRVGSFWEQVPNLEILGRCSVCEAPESMEHILLECEKPGQREVWRLAENLWQLRYSDWPKLNWGLLLGCGLARFRSPQGKIIPAKKQILHCYCISLDEGNLEPQK